MRIEDFRVIPQFLTHGVSEYGLIVSFQTSNLLSPYLWDDYLYYDLWNGCTSVAVRASRAVAQAWVYNPDPINLTIVNHIDGVKLNNYRENLEWSSHSQNNYHAVNSGLRNDNIPSLVRDFFDGKVYCFGSMAQAAEFMGFPKCTHIETLKPKMFGKLLQGRYEYKQAGDNTPWFYENREELVPPSRYMVVVEYSDGKCEEIYSNSELIKRFGLYGSGSKSIPNLVNYANSLYSDLKFTCRDSYSETKNLIVKPHNSAAMRITASNGTDRLDFDTLTKTAEYFNVDRSVINLRVQTGRDFNGWTFTTQPG